MDVMQLGRGLGLTRDGAGALLETDAYKAAQAVFR
jgi:hypothetical protein